MKATCPHCQKVIEIVGAGEIKSDFGLNDNRIQHAREKGDFPSPWLEFQNRKVYLRDDIAGYVAGLMRVQIDRAADVLTKETASMSAAEKKELLKTLEKRLR